MREDILPGGALPTFVQRPRLHLGGQVLKLAHKADVEACVEDVPGNCSFPGFFFFLKKQVSSVGEEDNSKRGIFSLNSLILSSQEEFLWRNRKKPKWTF